MIELCCIPFFVQLSWMDFFLQCSQIVVNYNFFIVDGFWGLGKMENGSYSSPGMWAVKDGSVKRESTELEKTFHYKSTKKYQLTKAQYN